jgi:uncharacterized protein with HEPN domain
VSPRSWQDRVDDILSCARNIREYTQGLSFESFLDDPRTIRAVAFEFTTIGEAASAMPEEVQKRHPQVPWGKMKGIRNVLVHEYFRLDEEILWRASQDDIPPLIAALEEILRTSG